MPDRVSERLHEAMEYAIYLHGRDARKCSAVPYLAHLFSVCALVQGDGGSEDEAIAALLHDALEDKPGMTSAEEVARRFGETVRDLLLACSDSLRESQNQAKAPWRQRKQEYLAKIRRTPPSMLRVSVADKVDNARSILADHRRMGDEVWRRFNAGKDQQLWYFRCLVQAYHDAGVRGWLVDELGRLATEIEAAAGSAP